jgi:uncharacterized protein GlcG (DUF336 family)
MLVNLIRHGAIAVAGAAAAALLASGTASAASCPVGHGTLKNQLQAAAAADSTGFNNNYWAVVVDNEGTVCAVAFSGANAKSQWLASRQIAAAKAFTAHGLSLDSAPISSGQLYASVQPGAAPNPLFGLAAGNALDAAAAYKGPHKKYGTSSDPMKSKRVGGTITFGGGLALYSGTTLKGGLGLSGDTACADHSTAWRLRILLNMAPTTGDDTIHLTNNLVAFGDHPRCPNDAGTQGATF